MALCGIIRQMLNSRRNEQAGVENRTSLSQLIADWNGFYAVVLIWLISSSPNTSSKAV